MRKRNIGVPVLTAATASSNSCSRAMGMNAPTGKCCGSFCVNCSLVAAAKFLNFCDTLFFCGLVFCLWRAVGSVINLYRTWDLITNIHLWADPSAALGSLYSQTHEKIS